MSLTQLVVLAVVVVLVVLWLKLKKKKSSQESGAPSQDLSIPPDQGPSQMSQ